MAVYGMDNCSLDATKDVKQKMEWREWAQTHTYTRYKSELW